MKSKAAPFFNVFGPFFQLSPFSSQISAFTFSLFPFSPFQLYSLRPRTPIDSPSTAASVC